MPRFVSESHATITQARIGKLVQTSVETPVMRTSLWPDNISITSTSFAYTHP
jgi:hypothetical protein